MKRTDRKRTSVFVRIEIIEGGESSTVYGPSNVKSRVSTRCRSKVVDGLDIYLRL